MAVYFTLLCRKAADLSVESTLDVDLVVAYPADLAGAYDFINAGDGTYRISIDGTVGGTCRGTVRINGVEQAEFENILFIGQDLLDHMGRVEYEGATTRTTLHGLTAADGAVVGIDAAQTLKNKIITDPTNEISAALLTSGIMSASRLDNFSIYDTKLAQITAANKVAGSAVQLSSVENPCLADNTGLYVLLNASAGLQRTISGLQVKLGAVAPGYTGLVLTADGLAIDIAANAGLELVAGGIQINADMAAYLTGMYNVISGAASLPPPWVDPQTFADDVTMLTAIQTLDSRVWYLLISTGDQYDKRALCVYAQGNIEFSVNTGAKAFDDEDTYMLSDSIEGIGRLKAMYPVFKSPTVHTICVRAQVRSENALGNTTMVVRVKDASGSIKHTAHYIHSGDEWGNANFNITMNTFADGFYFVEIWLMASTSYVSMARACIILIASYTWATFEIGNSGLWGGVGTAIAEDDPNLEGA